MWREAAKKTQIQAILTKIRNRKRNRFTSKIRVQSWWSGEERCAGFETREVEVPVGSRRSWICPADGSEVSSRMRAAPAAEAS